MKTVQGLPAAAPKNFILVKFIITKKENSIKCICNYTLFGLYYLVW